MDDSDKFGEATKAIYAVANALMPGGGSTARDATDGAVGSLTESVMGITAGLVRIADALENVAKAIRDSHK